MAGWILILGGCLFVLVAGLFFVLGVAAGASITFDQFGSMVLPILSAAGGWVSGVGALGAVVAALWLADKQRREDVESLRVKPQISMVTGVEGWLVSVEIVSTGKRPAVVQSVVISDPRSTMCLQVMRFYHQSRELPATLSYGEKISLICNPGFENEIAGYVVGSCEGRMDGLEVRVSTTLNDFTARLEGNFDWLLQEALAARQ